MSEVMELDLGPLTWVKSEIDLALSRAAEALGAAAANPATADTQVQFAQTHLHQACGALSIVGLDGLTQFTSTLEQLFGEMARGERDIDGPVLALCQRCLAATGNYLEELVHGTPDQPLRLLPLYTQIAAARKQAAPSGSELFFPDLSRRPARRAAAAVDAARWPQELKRCVMVYQRGLLKMLRSDDTPGGAREMLLAAQGIEKLHPQPAGATFWWVAQAFFEGLASGGLQPLPQVKKLCSLLERELRTHQPGQSAMPERLLRELLFHIAHAPAQTDTQRKVHDIWQLGALIPEDGAAVSSVPLAPLLKVLRAELVSSKRAWDEFSSGKASALPTFQAHIGRLGEQAKQLYRPALDRLLNGIELFAQWLRKDPLAFNEVVAIETASAQLLIEAALSEGGPEAAFAGQVSDTLNRLSALTRGEALPRAEQSATVRTARRGEEREALSQVGKEILSNLAHVEQRLDDFFRNQTKRAPLATLSAPLKQIEGALFLIGDDQATDLIRQVSTTISTLAESEQEAESGLFERLAQQLSALGFYVQALQHGPATLAHFLDPQAARKAAQIEDDADEALPPQDAVVPAADAPIVSAPEAATPRAEVAPAPSVTPAPSFELPPAVAATPAPVSTETVAPTPAPAPAAVVSAPAESEETDAELDAELLEIFIEEAHDVLSTLSEQLEVSRQSPEDGEALVSIRRGFHTLKGSGRMVGLVALGEVAWSVEQTMNRWLQMEWPPSADLYGMIEEAVSVFSAWATQIESGQGVQYNAQHLVAIADALRELEAPDQALSAEAEDAAEATAEADLSAAAPAQLSALDADADSAPTPDLALDTEVAPATSDEIAAEQGLDTAAAEAAEAAPAAAPELAFDAPAIPVPDLASEEAAAESAAPALPTHLDFEFDDTPSVVSPTVAESPTESPIEAQAEDWLAPADALPDTIPALPSAFDDLPTSVATPFDPTASQIVEISLEHDEDELFHGDDFGTPDTLLPEMLLESLEDPQPTAPTAELPPAAAVAADDVIDLSEPFDLAPAAEAPTPSADDIGIEDVTPEAPLTVVDDAETVATPAETATLLSAETGAAGETGDAELELGASDDDRELTTELLEEEWLAAGPALPSLEPNAPALHAAQLDWGEIGQGVDDFSLASEPAAPTPAPEPTASAPVAPALQWEDDSHAAPTPAAEVAPAVEAVAPVEAVEAVEADEFALDFSDALPSVDDAAEDELIPSEAQPEADDEPEEIALEGFEVAELDDDTNLASDTAAADAAPALDDRTAAIESIAAPFSADNLTHADAAPAALPPEALAAVPAFVEDSAANASADTESPAEAEVEPTQVEPETPAPESAAPASIASDIARIGSVELSRGLFELFIGEAEQHISVLHEELAQLRVNPTRSPSEPALRAAHTLASISGTARVQSMFELGRCLEHAIERLRNNGMAPRPDQCELLSAVVDRMDGMLTEATLGVMPLAVPEFHAALGQVGELPEDPYFATPLALEGLDGLDDLAALSSAFSDSDATITALADSASGLDAGAQADPAAAHYAEEDIAETAEAIESAPSAPALPAVESADQPVSTPVASAEPPAIAPAANSADSAPTFTAPTVHDDIDDQLLPIFLEEAEELISNLHGALRAWGGEPDSAEHIKATARLLHTLKGSARMTGAMTLGEFVHQLETHLETGLAGSRERMALIDDITSGVDYAEQVVDALARGEAIPEFVAPGSDAADATQAPTAEGAPASQTAAPTSTARPTAKPESTAQAGDSSGEVGGGIIRVRADMVDRFVNEAGEIGIARTRIEGELRTLRRSLLDLTENVIRLRNQLREVEIQAEMQMQTRIAQAEQDHADFDPLEMDRYTRLQELTRLMAESVGDVTTVQQNLLRNLDGAELALHGQARMSRDLQQALMQVRMVPFDSLADRLYRVVRQSAKDLGKRVNLDIRGGRIEVDRSVLERITAPLEHLLRNSIAHGIEVPEVRRQNGKEETGQLTLNVSHEANEILLVLSDDGKGLDYDAILKRARARGLLEADESPDTKRLTNMIFLPGFSTAENVSNVSGRGVGMDVVKSETAAVGGRIDIASQPQQGTEFRIYLPLTLAVTQAVLVRAGQHTYAIPSSMVAQVMELKEAPLQALREQGGIDWNNERFNYRYLPRLLGDQETQPEAQRFNWVLLLRAGSQTLALHVDSLRGNQEIVVKNAGPQLVRIIGITGATVLGDGEIVLILNPVALASRYLDRSIEAAAEAQAAAATPVERTPTVMIVDDSLTVRKITGRLLEREGYRVMTAKDGSDALEKLVDALPDVILSDIEMPRMDGFDFVRHVRADERTHNIPVIMITSRLAEKHRQYALKLGANHYLGKPFEEEELLGLLRSYTHQALQPA